MNRLFRLGIFVFVVLVLLGGIFWIINREGMASIRNQNRNDLEQRKLGLTIVIQSFYTYYHVWPGPPGRVDDAVSCELMGCADAKINTQHINFFDRNHVGLVTQDLNGNDLSFNPDNATGTCMVY
jgi:hypothetical protein